VFRISEIEKATGGKASMRQKNRRFAGICADSRTIKRGELFICLRGERFDGHDFIRQALRRGARGVVVSDTEKYAFKGAPVIRVKDTLKALGDIAAYHRRRFAVPAVGITGSNGKTTAKEMIAHILGRRYNVLKNAGTENNLIGLPLALLRLKKMHDIAVLEMGTNRPGEIGRLTEILKPSIGVITNIGLSHLEFLKNKQGVLKAKSELIRRLRRGDKAVLNGDDAMLSRARTRAGRITFGFKGCNDFRAACVKSDGGVRFVLNGAYPFRIDTPGSYNIYNALAAIAVARQFGVSIHEMREALASFEFPAMRMERRNIKGITVINDAYNSNPLSLRAAVETLSGLKAGRKIIVSGDMYELGARSRYYHGMAGRVIAASSVDALVTVGPLSGETAAAAGRAGMNGRSVTACSDAREAAGILKRLARKGDAVLIKGSRAMKMGGILEALDGDSSTARRKYAGSRKPESNTGG